jgi:hypothetical protein
VVNATFHPLYSREINPLLSVREAGSAPGPVWTGAENLASTGIRFPDRPIIIIIIVVMMMMMMMI